MKSDLILIGGGGHCKSCIDVIEQEGRFRIAGIIDNDLEVETVLGYPVLGTDNQLAELRASCDYALVTVGHIKSPSVRIRLYEYAKSLGFRLPTIISPRAYISKHARTGDGGVIMHDALINANVSIGNNFIINSKALIEHDCLIEDDCHISTGAIINGGVTIKRGTFVGSNAVTKEGVQTGEGDFIKAGSIFTGHADE